MLYRPILVHRARPASTGFIALALATLILATFLFSHGLANAAGVPTITSVSPSSGTTGTTVSVVGTGFMAASPFVTFGGTAAPSVVVTDDSHLSVTAPARAPGTVDVRVQTIDGISAIVPADQFTYSSPTPAITGVSPSSGQPGNLVTISGSGFTGATSVSFGGSLAAPTVASDTQLTAIVPSHALGTVNVQVNGPGGTSPVVAAGQFTYTAVGAAPVVTSVAPSSGVSGTTVTINGSGFTGATSVNIGGTLVSPTVFSDSVLTATAPAHAPGIVTIQVTTPLGTSPVVAAGQFTYIVVGGTPAITNVSPSIGVAGTTVTITGSGFTGATSVLFGNTLASPTVISDTQISVLAPAHALGTYNVFVTSPQGTSPVVAGAQFTYASGVPTVTSISPATGVAGTIVIITGTGFAGATVVTFGGISANFTVDSDTQITAIVPLGFGTGIVNVVVTTPVGFNVVTLASQFTYGSTAAPTVTGVSPSSGPVSGGTVITITGTGFTGATAVSVASVAVTSFTVNSSTQITATTPANSAPGTYSVQVTGPNGSSANNTNARFTYVSLVPTITSVSPSSGPGAGGTGVIITGTGFTGVTSVRFGGVAASFSVRSDTQISSARPAHSTGTVDVTVTSPAGTNANTGADNFTYTTNFCPVGPFWTDDLAYGSAGGGFYWDNVSGLVWTAQRSWHLFSPQPPRSSILPFWIDALTYGSAGGGFYWDSVSGQVWTAERGWHLYSPQGCV